MKFLLSLFVFTIYTNTFSQTGWVLQSSGTNDVLFAVTSVDAKIATVVGSNGTILHTINGGTTWNKQTSNTSNILQGVSFNDANHGLIVGNSGTILRTIDGGTNWNIVSSNTQNELDDVKYLGSSIAVAVGWNGTIVRSNDSGKTWSLQNSNTVQGLVGVHFSNNSMGTAVGWNGTIVRTTDTGLTWFNQTNPLSGTYLDLWGIYLQSSTNGIATGENGTILRTSDGGNIWYTIAGGSAEKLWCVSFGDSLTGMIAGDSVSKGRLLKTTDGGKNWTILSNDTTPTFFGIVMNGPTSAFAVGTSGKILHTTTGGTVGVNKRISTGIIDGIILFQNYPNPFNPSTVISYQIPMNSHVSLKVYDAIGREVATLVNEVKEAGSYSATFNASKYSSGIYFAKLQSGDKTQLKKMQLIK